MAKTETDSRLEEARCLWSTIQLFNVAPAEYLKKWNFLDASIREKVLTEGKKPNVRG